VVTEAGAPILGGTSVKAALDLDWDDPPGARRRTTDGRNSAGPSTSGMERAVAAGGRSLHGR